MQGVIRVRSATIVPKIKPNLVYSDERCREAYVEELVHMLVNNPDRVFILAKVDGEEVTAFLIAIDPGINYPFVTVTNAWNDSHNGWDVADHIFARTLVWAAAMGKDYVRAETLRNTKAMYRRFGFEPFSEVMKVDLTDLNDLINNQPRKVIEWTQT